MKSKKLKFEFFRSKSDKQWYGHLKSGNGNIIMATEGVHRRRSMLKVGAALQSSTVTIVEK